MTLRRPDYLRDSPRFDRTHWPLEWSTEWRYQVADLFCGRGGVGRALGRWLPRRMFFGVDKVDYSDDYPGRFVQADLIDDRPFDGVIADVAWVSFPCTAYSSLSATEYGSAEKALERNPRITDELREWLLEHFGHYVIENVPRASYHGDLDANCRVNGLAFGEGFNLERHFETTFSVPDAYQSGETKIPVDTRDDQSVAELAEAKGVPAEWGKQSVRSALPWQYVWWVLSYCPSIDIPTPKQDQLTMEAVTGNPGRFQMFAEDRMGGTDVAPGDQLYFSDK